MEPLDIFTVQDLTQRSDDLLRDAEEGRLSLITKVAGLPIVDFLDLVGQAGIPAVDYSPDELEQDLQVARAGKDLLRDICTASRQIDEGQGISHLEAQSQALARLRA